MQRERSLSWPPREARVRPRKRRQSTLRSETSLNGACALASLDRVDLGLPPARRLVRAGRLDAVKAARIVLENLDPPASGEIPGGEFGGFACRVFAGRRFRAGIENGPAVAMAMNGDVRHEPGL